MQVDIRYSPSFALAAITLPAGAEVNAEARAMVSMTGDVDIETRAQGGVLSSLKRSVFGKESFFINTFSASRGGELTVAPPFPGDIFRIETSGRPLYVQSGSWLASDSSVAIDTKWSGGRTFFTGEGLFLLKCTGQGEILAASYGAIERRELAPGEVFKIDTGHFVAFEEGVRYDVARVGNWKSTFLSGEGLVASFTGPGAVWMQSRSPADFVGWLSPKLQKSRMPDSSGSGNGFSFS